MQAGAVILFYQGAGLRPQEKCDFEGGPRLFRKETGFSGSIRLFYRAADAAPAIPATESTLGSHPCVALSSAQVLLEWINRNLVGNRFAANGDNPLNFVSHSRGSLHCPRLSSQGPGARTALRTQK
jgi:hypothetical protein